MNIMSATVSGALAFTIFALYATFASPGEWYRLAYLATGILLAVIAVNRMLDNFSDLED